MIHSLSECPMQITSPVLCAELSGINMDQELFLLRKCAKFVQMVINNFIYVLFEHIDNKYSIDYLLVGCVNCWANYQFPTEITCLPNLFSPIIRTLEGFPMQNLDFIGIFLARFLAMDIIYSGNKRF